MTSSGDHVPRDQPGHPPLPPRPRPHAQLVDQQAGGGGGASWQLTFGVGDDSLRQVRTIPRQHKCCENPGNSASEYKVLGMVDLVFGMAYLV